MSPSVFAGGHSGEFSEVRVEIAAVAVAHGFTDLPRRHFWVFTEHRTGIAQAQLVPTRAEVHSVLAFHECAHRRRVGVESFEYVFVGNVLLPMFSLGLPLPKPFTKSIQLLLSIMFLTLGGIVLMAASFGTILLIGRLIGNYAAGAFIVAAFFLILIVVLYLLRDRLFINGLVRMFVRLFFDDNEKGGER